MTERRDTDFDLGFDHFMRFTQWNPDRHLNPQYRGIKKIELYGLIIIHIDANGKECSGHVTFDLPEVREVLEISRKTTEEKGHVFHMPPLWQVHDLSIENFHIEPSLLCACGDHGFIRAGKWAPA